MPSAVQGRAHCRGRSIPIQSADLKRKAFVLAKPGELIMELGDNDGIGETIATARLAAGHCFGAAGAQHDIMQRQAKRRESR